MSKQTLKIVSGFAIFLLFCGFLQIQIKNADAAGRTITNPAANSPLSSAIIRNELQTLENETFNFPFSINTNYVGTTTPVGFLGGLFAISSSTFNGLARFTNSSTTVGSFDIASSTRFIAGRGAAEIDYSFSGNETTGMYHSGSNQVSLVANNNVNFTVSSAAIGFSVTMTGSDLIVNNTLKIPSSSTQSPTTAGQVGHDTSSDQIKFGNGSVTKVLGNGNQYASFTYSTSTAWVATTTIPLGPASIAETWNNVKCFTDVGSLQVSFGDATTTASNRMNFLNASTTIGTINTTTNNTYTAGEKRFVDVGTPLNAPTSISCTVSKSITAD